MTRQAVEVLKRWAVDPVFGPVMTFAGTLAGYVLLALCGYQLIGASSGVASFWPPNGLTVALLVLLAPRSRPWVIAAVLPAELIADAMQGYPALTALGWGSRTSSKRCSPHGSCSRSPKLAPVEIADATSSP